MIPNGEKCGVKSEGRWHYLAVRKLSALLKILTSKHYGDFHRLNCIHFFRTKNKLEAHKKYVKIKVL